MGIWRENRRWGFVTCTSRSPVLPEAVAVSSVSGSKVERVAKQGREAWMGSGPCSCVWEWCVLLRLFQLRIHPGKIH